MAKDSWRRRRDEDWFIWHDNDERINADVAETLTLFALGLIFSGVLVFACFAAWISAAVVMAAVWLVDPAAVPPYGAAFRASFLGTVVLIGISVVVALLLLLIRPAGDPGSGTFAGADVLLVALAGVPALAGYAAILTWRLGGVFGGVAGFAWAFVVAIPSVATGVGAPVLGFMLAAQRFAAVDGDLVIFFMCLLPFTVAAFLYTIFAAILAGFALWVLTGLLAPARTVSYGMAYGTALLALAGQLFITTSVVLLRSDSNPLITFLSSLVHAGNALDTLRGQRILEMIELVVPLHSFRIAQIPGVLFGGAIVAARVGDPYLGLWGYAKACLVMAIGLMVAVAGTVLLVALVRNLA